MNTVKVLVEVDVALARPPRVDAQLWTWIAVEQVDRFNVDADARLIACEMAACDPRVVMPLGARVIDWEE